MKEITQNLRTKYKGKEFGMHYVKILFMEQIKYGALDPEGALVVKKVGKNKD